jgi:hypothetical protein
MNLRNLLPYLAAIMVALCWAGGVRADAIVNGGFETGDLTGWTTGGNGSVSVVTTNPYEGNYCALMQTGGSGEMMWSQLFNASANEVISFAWRGVGDAGPGYTNAFANIYGPYIYGGVTLYDETDLPPSSAWQVYSYEVPTTGSYSVLFDTGGDSTVQFYFDDVQVTPEPASVGLLAVGLSALLLRRKTDWRK